MAARYSSATARRPAAGSVRPEALLILGAPGPNPARLAAMLGNHADATLLPELALGMADSLASLRRLEERGQQRLRDGWLRALAWLHGAPDSTEAISQAEHWLMRRADWSLREAVDALRAMVAPRAGVLVESLAPWRIHSLESALDCLPGLRVLHLSEHPMLDCARMAQTQKRHASIPIDYRDFGTGHDRAALDPQLAWLRIHETIERACAARPELAYRHLDWHQLARAPEDGLSELLEWLGWRSDARQINAMQHPERASLACRGPARAPGGLDADFLHAPGFEARLTPRTSLDGAVAWRNDGVTLAPETVALARRLGYR